METRENTSTEEQGSASALAEPKDNKQEPTTNTAATNNFTDEEKQLAKRYQVEPRLVRLLKEIVKEHFVEPEDTETQAEPAELCIDQQTQKRIKDFYKNLDPRTKLAIVALSDMQALEGINFQISKKEEKLFNLIFEDLESVCLETFHAEPGDVAPGTFGSEDIWLAGVWESTRMILQNT